MTLKKTVTAEFQVELAAGPTELLTTLTSPDGQIHGAYFATITPMVATDPGPGQLTLDSILCRQRNSEIVRPYRCGPNAPQRRRRRGCS